MPAPYDVGAIMPGAVFPDTAEQKPNLPRQEASAVDAYVAGPGIVEGARRAVRAMYDTLYQGTKSFIPSWFGNVPGTSELAMRPGR